MTCKNHGCTNPVAPRRRICTVCRNRKRGEAAKRARAINRKPYGPCNPDCPGWQDCTTKRLWVDGPLPCETMLPDEVGISYDTEERSYYVIPLPIRYGVEA